MWGKKKSDRISITPDTVPRLVNSAINSNAFCWLNILFASCTHGINKSTFLLYLVSSSKFNNKHDWIISLSETTPSALINIKSGTGFLTFGIETTNCLLLKRGEGAMIFTAVVLIGLEVSSETDRISAEWLYISSSLFFFM